MTTRTGQFKRKKPGLRIDAPGTGNPVTSRGESGRRSIDVVRPKATAAPLLKGYSGHDRPPASSEGAPGTGRVLPSQTGKPWPGGGRVPAPDTGNQDATRVSVRVTPRGSSVHYHVGVPVTKV